MRLVQGCALLVLGSVMVAAAPPPAGVRDGATYAGDWETLIDSPRRPWIFLVRLRLQDSSWTGVMSIEGLRDFPLDDVRADAGRVHFRLPPQLDALVFDGELEDGAIVGAVSGSGQTIPTRLTRRTPLPAPAGRLEAWQQDVDFLAARLGEYDRSFTPSTRQALEDDLAQLRHELPRMNDAEILVALSRAVALGGNAHTRLRLDPTSQGTFSTGFPIRIWWFSDGPYVLKAARQYRRAAGCRLVAIGDHEVAEARRQVEDLFAGNDSWDDYLSPIYLTSPDVLYGLGLTRSRDRAPFTFEDERGSRFSLWLRAERVDPSAMPSEAWQDLSPRVATGKPPWVSALEAGPDSAPLYLRHPLRPYWFEFLPETGLLYFQFNHSGDAHAGPSFREFGDSLLAFAAHHSVRGVAVDLRLNSGGNLEVARDFMKSLGADPMINREGRLFVIIGRCTFSAGLFHAAQLRQSTRAIFVGEPAGDRLDFWAEGGALVLPNSRAVVRFSNGFHRYSREEHPEYPPYYEELSIASLGPDVAAPLSSKDYFRGRDPSLEAIEARLPR